MQLRSFLSVGYTRLESEYYFNSQINFAIKKKAARGDLELYVNSL